jgi:glycosyltransferase involved in cell wall biosynthesis
MLDFLFSMVYYFFTLMNRNPEVVFIVKPYPNTVLPALMMRSRGARLVIDVDDLDHGYRKNLLSGIIKWMQFHLINTAYFLTSHNDELIKLIKKEHPLFVNRIYKLKQCVDLELFSPKRSDASKVRAIRDEFKGRKVLFYMAHLNIASCLDDIIEATARLKSEDAVLLIVGGGTMYGHYKRLADKKLPGKAVFLGQLPRKLAIDYIMASDLCLVYYKKTPVNKFRASMKLREYLALSKNVVADAVGEIRDFRKVVYLSRPSITAYAAEIRKRMKSLDNRAKKGYKVICKEYNWAVEAGKFYHFLAKEPA